MRWRVPLLLHWPYWPVKEQCNRHCQKFNENNENGDRWTTTATITDYEEILRPTLKRTLNLALTWLRLIDYLNRLFG